MALCVLVAAMALMYGAAASCSRGPDAVPPAPEEGVSPGAAPTDGAARGSAGPADPQGSSQPGPLRADGDFLALLAQRALEGEGGARPSEVSVSWSEEAGLVETASGLLGRYREEPTAELVASGYVDLKGNVWAALVRDARGWVDVVSVRASDEDRVSAVGIVRLLAGGGEEEEAP